MFNIGDLVRVKDVSTTFLCKITDMGEDDKNVMWYTCTPIEFNSFSREFTADKLEKVC